MSTIYIVTCGEYSDYGVVCAFTHEKDAVDYAKLFGYGVESISIDEWEGHDRYRGRTYYRCTQWLKEWQATFSLRTYRQDEITVGNSWDIEYLDGNINQVKKDYYDGTPASPILVVNVAARDKEHAIKISSDLFRIYKSEESYHETDI
jgi:hypothetical protein